MLLTKNVLWYMARTRSESCSLQIHDKGFQYTILCEVAIDWLQDENWLTLSETCRVSWTKDGHQKEISLPW
jgi:hypothetical protein